MGTDNLGRDVYSRVVYGARVSITVGFGAVLLANVLAALIGITSGYFGGAYDICVQRVVDAWQSFPVPGGHPVDHGRPRARACST